MMHAATIKLFLPTGDATGIRTAEISNWTGKAIAGPRSALDGLLKREELNKPGVYILIGSNEAGDPHLYIGEAECVKTRLPQHRSKEFWVQLVAFTSKDENLTKGHIKYLEAELIKRAELVDKASLENSQGGKAVLPESDIADMEVFLSKVYQLLPVMGCDYFNAVAAERPKAADSLYCKKHKIEAKGLRSANGFVIYKGSCAVKKETVSIPPNISAARSKLIEKGVLKADGEALVFTRDYECSSPSYASSIVRGAASNGMVDWKNKAGVTLRDLEGEGG